LFVAEKGNMEKGEKENEGYWLGGIGYTVFGELKD